MPRAVAVFAGLVVLTASASAEGQVLGPFRWQTLPFCNVLTLTIAQQGGQFLLTGTDNLCGAGIAPVVGTAVVNGASVAMGMTVSLPSGGGAHLTASLALATISGPWQDADGRTGTFQFLVGAGTNGPPRPAPASAAVILSSQLSPTAFGGTGVAATLARSDHDHDTAYAPRHLRRQLDGSSARDTTGASFNNCQSDPTRLFYDIDIPVGAALTQVAVTAMDGPSSTPYAMQVFRGTVEPAFMSYVTVLSASGGSSTAFATVRHAMTPITPIVLAPGQSFQLMFLTGGPSTNGVCLVEYAYTLPAAP
jgi:hypothetical protein